MISPTDRDLVRLYVPAGKRPAFNALFAIDAAMGDVLRSTAEPMVGRIRLAWWRERLEELDRGVVPAEPRLVDAERLLLPAGVCGADLAGLEEGWANLLDPFPWAPTVADAIASRGGRLFGLGAALLDETSRGIEAAGELWALVDAVRHCSDAGSRDLLIDRARAAASGLDGTRFAKSLRSLSMLAALALRDLARWPAIEPEATPGRALVLLRHRLTGRLPQIG